MNGKRGKRIATFHDHAHVGRCRFGLVLRRRRRRSKSVGSVQREPPVFHEIADVNGHVRTPPIGEVEHTVEHTGMVALGIGIHEDAYSIRNGQRQNTCERAEAIGVEAQSAHGDFLEKSAAFCLPLRAKVLC